MHLVQRDLAHFSLTGFDVRPQQHRGLVAALALDRLEDLRVLVVGGVDARLLGEVQPPDDPDPFRHVAVHACHLRIARCGDESAVEFFVPLRHLHHVAAAPGHCHRPDRDELVQQLGVHAPAIGAKALHRRRLEHHAQVVQLLEPLEVERQHPPAASKQHFDIAFLLQSEQRLPNRCPRHAEPFAQLVLGEAVAGDQAEFRDVALELLIDLVGARAMLWRDLAVRGAPGGGMH